MASNMSEGDGPRYGAGPSPDCVSIVTRLDNPLSRLGLADDYADVVLPHNHDPNIGTGSITSIASPVGCQIVSGVGNTEMLP